MAKVSCVIVQHCNVVGFLDVWADIIQLRNETHIHCIDEDPSSMLFTSPPIKGNIPSIENQKYIDWKEDDWTNGNANDFPTAPKTDKRWEGFEIKRNKRIQFSVEESISFSVYGAHKLEFNFDNSEELDEFKFSSNSGEDWIHFTALLKNNNAYILKNNEIIYTSDNFHPTNWIVANEKEVYWKMHNRKLKWSNTVSSTLSFVTIPPTNNSILLMYISLCPHCTLEITSLDGAKIISNHHTNSHTNDWQPQKIDLDAEIETTIAIVRKSKTDTVDGYWIVDFLLRNVTNTVSYKLSPDTETDNYTCRELNKILSVNDVHKTKLGSAVKRSSCDAGKLGTNCTIDCANILGEKFNYCDKHYICQDSHCTCSWGYAGRNCNQTCEAGKWGFDCTEQCIVECKNHCDIFTGKCPDPIKMRPPRNSHTVENRLSNTSIAIVAVVGVIVTGFVIILVRWLYFKRKVKTHTHEMEYIICHTTYNQIPGYNDKSWTKYVVDTSDK